MDTLQTEIWQMVASGFVEEALATFIAIQPKDTRGVLERDGAMAGWFRLRASVGIQYAPSNEAVAACLAFIDNKRYAPVLSDLYLKPTGAAVQNGTTLVADAPDEPFQLYVYEWNYVQFTLLGLLSANNQPGAGVYVIVPESQTRKGVPSAFLTVA
jgi:hypothetical protein